MATKVNVYFSFYDMPYAEWPERIPLGATNWQNAKKIVNAFRTYKPGDNACIRTMTAELSQTHRGEFDRGRNKSRNGAGLELSGMFVYTDGFRAPCMGAHAKIPQNDMNMTKMCAHNFRTGKCRDPFMVKTLGAILYPQFYADKKVKGK